MATSLSNSPEYRAGSFQQIVAAFVGHDGLPFADVLTAERITHIFARHGGLFAFSGVYSTAMVLWAFLSQVLQDGKGAACQAAVASISTHCLLRGQEPPTSDTGDYCRSRMKLSEPALRELSREVADDLEAQAESHWLWKGMHPQLIDGFTFTMPDTDKNQTEYPQSSAQKPGIGFPIARVVAVISLATACLRDAAMGPYSGKQTGETALLRSLLSEFGPTDVAVIDRYYCSFMMIAQFASRGTHMCARQHHVRETDFRRGRRLGKRDHIVHWIRPGRPKWMDHATYDTIPETMAMREVHFTITQHGRRTKSMTIVTTLTDSEEYSKDDLAELYGFRWNVELDIRSIKQNLNLDHVRCKSPHTVRLEFRTTLLAYNLIRSVSVTAALLQDTQPRQISFTSTCQYVLSCWMPLSVNSVAACRLEDFCRTLLKRIAKCEVGHRPGRLEPRVLKRRRHSYPLMQKPRDVLRRELRKHCT